MVIAIIGILASIALPSYQTYSYRAKAAEVVVVLDKLHTVLAGFQAEKGNINQPYCVHDTLGSSGTASALEFSQISNGKLAFSEVAGMNKAELSLNQLGIDIHVASCVTNASSSGQYLVIILPKKGSGAESRQVALAVQHVMQAQAYKTMATSTGPVFLYFQL